MKPGWVYILVGRTGTLYTGVTNDLYRRIQEHRTKFHSGFTAKYDCKRLAYYERHEGIVVAISRGEANQGLDAGEKDCADYGRESRVEGFIRRLGQANGDASEPIELWLRKDSLDSSIVRCGGLLRMTLSSEWLQLPMRESF